MSVVGAVAVMAVANAAGWASGKASGGAAGLALAAVLTASLAGLVLLVLLVGQDLRRLAMAVVGAGVARMLASLGLGLALYLILQPEGKTFWATFLVCNLLCLVVETAWGMVTNQRVHGESRPRDGVGA